MDVTINESESSKLLDPCSDAGVLGDYGASIANEQMKTNRSDRIEIDQSAQVHSWLMPFFVNIFLACASFSIVMPSLAPYLFQIGAPLSFLPWVVSSYSIGEMIGSATIGLFYEHATKTCQVEGRGPRISLLLCSGLGIIGSAMYAVAGWIEDHTIAQHCVLFGRFVQGTWTGGQQAVEQGKGNTMAVFSNCLHRL
jgi:MFS family permease